MKNFNNLLARHEIRLIAEIGIPIQKTKSISTEIAIEVIEIKKILLDVLNNMYVVNINYRMNELYALDKVLYDKELILKNKNLYRILLNYQNYILFVYLKDTLFDVLKEVTNPNSITKKIAKYLTDGKVRYFRNSIAHGNYKLLDDSSGMEYWAEKDSKKQLPLSHFQVTIDELQFWIDLSKTLAITTYLTLLENN